MDIAIVTGAASGIGLAIARKLVDMGCRVYGLGGDYKEINYSHRYFIPVGCDLSNVNDIKKKTDTILEREKGVYILVNNAKFTPRKAFFGETNLADLEMVVRINLLCPLVLTRLCLPSLTRLQGFVVNIVPTSAELSRGGPAGAAANGGLRWMSEALFEECREQGVKVTSLFPQSNPYRPGEKAEPIDPKHVAAAVGNLILHSDGNLVTELVIRPQHVKENSVPPPLNVPYPAPKPVPMPPDERASTADMVKTQKAVKAAARKTARRKVQQRMAEERRKAEEEKKRIEAEKQKKEEAPKQDAPPKKKRRRRSSSGKKKTDEKGMPSQQEKSASKPEEKPSEAPVKKKRPRRRRRASDKPKEDSKDKQEPKKDTGSEKKSSGSRERQSKGKTEKKNNQSSSDSEKPAKKTRKRAPRRNKS